MALSFADLINAEDGMNVPLDLEIPGTLFDLDNSMCEIIQTGGIEKDFCQKKSPFHESDSGMSEDYCSVGSPGSVTDSFDRQNSGKMLDELVESLDIEPFCGGSDQDLANYFGGKLPESDNEDPDVSSTFIAGNLHSQMSVTDESQPSSPEEPTRTLRGRTVRTKGKTAPGVSKVVKTQTVSKPLTVPQDVSSSQNTGIKSIKVLKVIKTTGIANTADEVMKALEDRNKKNAVQAKVNREKKKHYITSLEEEVSVLKSNNRQLEAENDTMKKRTSSLEEEIQYLRAVLANDSGLSKVLGSIQNVQNVKLKSSFVSRKRSAEIDHDYFSSKRSKSVVSTAGVCLHVDNDTVSLEFCSKCSHMAKSSEDD